MAAVVLLAGTLSHAGAAGEKSSDRYLELLHRKRTLLREAALLQRETEWAAGKPPYIFFNAESRQLEFRMRGKILKTYPVKGIFLDEGLRRPASPEAIWRALDKPITVYDVQGGRPELVPPDPEAGRTTGLLYSDPNQLSSQTGATSVDTDAGILGVDAPAEYFIQFDEEVIFHIRSPRDDSIGKTASRRLSELAAGLRGTIGGWFGGASGKDGTKFRLTLYLTLESEVAKFLHYSLLPGEKLIVVPPGPPPVVLVSSGSAAR
ncbi:MAG: hypothetical protein ACREAA_13430 [Candidatus Polarisedimenticolia bacterium]